MLKLFSLSSIFKVSNLKIFGGLYLGWGIGANDSANIFGTAVATNSIKYKTAVWLIAFFVILGSSMQGWHLYKDYDFSKKDDTAQQKQLTEQEKIEKKKQNYTDALISTLAAAVAVTIVTIMSIPASTSQAAVGAYMGIAIAVSGTGGVDWNNFLRMLICWVATPIGSAIVTVILYTTISKVLNAFFGNNLSKLNQIYVFLLVIAGCYGAYELGANNVVCTTGPYYKAGVFGKPVADELFYKISFWKNPAFWASTLGGFAIAIGALTYSKKVMYTVGSKITALDPYSAMITVFSHSIALMIFTALKVPVSSSQAIVGAVIGIGMLSGSKTVSYKTLGFIFLGWLLTPLSGALIAFLIRLGLMKFSL